MSVPVYIRSLIFTLIVPPVAAGWIPYLLANSKIDSALLGKAPNTFVTDIIGVALLITGSLIYLWCVFDFTFVGRGTPAIFDPPKNLVVRGLYKYVRNPMYIGITLAILGQVLIYGSPVVLIFGITFWLVFFVFVLIYEEPVLRKQFGEDYVRYREKVNRWIPS